MDSASPPSHQASPFGLATLKKAVNVLAHYVDFSDNSSSWSGSQPDADETETPNSEDLRTPLLQSQPAKPDTVITADDDSEHVGDKELLGQAPAAEKVSSSPEPVPLSESDVDVQSPHGTAGRASSSNDGTQTPTKHDLRTPLMQSQPVEQGIASSVHSESPKVPPSGALENLGSGLLNPSLLEQLLDDHAPPPDMPYAGITHVVPVTAPDHPGEHSAQHLVALPAAVYSTMNLSGPSYKHSI